jgi:hypothetical protein
MAKAPDLNQVFYVLIALAAFIAIAAVGVPAVVSAIQTGASTFGAWQGVFVVIVLAAVVYVVYAKRHE